MRRTAIGGVAAALMLLACAPARAAAPVGVTPAAASPPALAATDLAAWLDGFIPNALQRGDIAGAEVVVVKDGAVLLEKGYGYADVAARRPIDPRTTLMRPGSISKLFAWTAVMQLAEAGKLDLDADVNRYLDFRIPPGPGGPITLRDLLTHRPGFEERFEGVVTRSARDTPTLEAFVKGWTPSRIHPRGQVPAYSNYGATLAGYIVQRVSGEPFEAYVARHIFAPLGMAHATFAQPPDPAADAAVNYVRGSGPPHGFEYVGDVPAGALSISGDDMARFMLAHLGEGAWQGRRILGTDWARRMQAPAWAAPAPFNSMALGFYGEDRNGHRILGHAGDLIASHADLHLMPQDHVGFYVAMNSWGRDNASTALREALFRGFVDRYFPGSAPTARRWRDDPGEARLLLGAYETSRRAEDTFASLGTVFGQGVMRRRPDGALVFSRFLEGDGQPSVWRRVGPGLWRNADGSAEMLAELHDGRVTRLISSQQPPVLVWAKTPAWRDARWSAPLLIATFAVLALTVLSWLIIPLARRVYDRPFARSRSAALAHRLSRLGALANLGFLGGWLAILLSASADPALLAPSLHPVLRLIQALGVLGLALGTASPWNLAEVWRARPRRWLSRAANLALTAAWLATGWFALAFHLLRFSLKY